LAATARPADCWASFGVNSRSDPFVVDFYCDEAALIVGVDGPIHEFQRRADTERQDSLEGLELKMLRLSADIVENDMPTALTMIRRSL
jgi:very-short-patch-repair endonuclease